MNSLQEVSVASRGAIYTADGFKDRFKITDVRNENIGNVNVRVYTINILKYPFFVSVALIECEEFGSYYRIFINKDKYIDIHNPFEYAELIKRYPNIDKEFKAQGYHENDLDYYIEDESIDRTGRIEFYKKVEELMYNDEWAHGKHE